MALACRGQSPATSARRETLAAGNSYLHTAPPMATHIANDGGTGESKFILLGVIDIMTESLYDKCVDEHGVVDFARSGGMSNQKQSKKFLRALNEQCDL
uniref:MCM8/REC winged helix domain-containing protein n=1 Tax=Oryza rufipogon TaxID=4529 RepID=A0A0E0R7R0_ORYRU